MAKTVHTAARHIPKGWGYELIIANNGDYCGKILHVEKGKKCSMHFHVNKHETFYIVRGCIIMRLIRKDGSQEEFEMITGAVLEIHPGLMHQFESLPYTDTDIVEVSTTHENSDSYRVSKGD
jgi:mannose-6-phosphate isomerase-like protein (cupin superfamily)